MEIYYYQTGSPGEAFDIASKDTHRWNFAEMDALADMAQQFGNGFVPTMPLGSGILCPCSLGTFVLFEDRSKGYGIALLQLKGHEAGIDDPAAQEVLDYHREHRTEEIYAEALLVCAEHISTILDLDEAYNKLLAGKLIEKSAKEVIVMEGTQEHQRLAFRLPQKPTIKRKGI